MQTLVEILFVLGLILPPAAVAVGVCVVAAGSMLVHRRSQAGDRRGPQQQPVALHHPAGR
jgi:hypothetical protein